jgi:hypothetical protein
MNSEFGMPPTQPKSARRLTQIGADTSEKKSACICVIRGHVEFAGITRAVRGSQE